MSAATDLWDRRVIVRWQMRVTRASILLTVLKNDAASKNLTTNPTSAHWNDTLLNRVGFTEAVGQFLLPSYSRGNIWEVMVSPTTRGTWIGSITSSIILSHNSLTATSEFDNKLDPRGISFPSTEHANPATQIYFPPDAAPPSLSPPAVCPNSASGSPTL